MNVFGNLFDNTQNAEVLENQAENEFDNQQTEWNRTNMNKTRIDLIQWQRRKETHCRQLSGIK